MRGAGLSSVGDAALRGHAIKERRRTQSWAGQEEKLLPVKPLELRLAVQSCPAQQPRDLPVPPPQLRPRPPCSVWQPAASPAARQRPTTAALCAALVLTYAVTFGMSLEGSEDPLDGTRFLRSHAFKVAPRALLAAVAAFTGAAWLAALLPTAGRRAVWSSLALICLGYLAYSHDTTYADHGLLNFIAFWVLATPPNLTLLTLWLVHAALRPKRFLYTLAGGVLCLGVCSYATLHHFEQQWSVGFYGRTMAPGCASAAQCAHPYCDFPRTIPWVDLLPAGTQNAWTGSQSCPAVSGFEASFDEGGLLTISDCDPSERTEYTLLPRMELWAIENRTMWGDSMHSAVLDSMRVQRYVEPVQLGDTEAVLARCGDAVRLLVRVAALPLIETNSSHATSTAQHSVAASEDLATTHLAASSGASTQDAPEPGLAHRGNSGGVDEPHLNLLIVFIDSLSRRHFFRRMSRSAAALERLPAGGVTRLHQFFRYHIVGFNTGPNTHALFTGTPYPGVSGATPICDSYRAAGYVVGSACNFCYGWGATFNERPLRHHHELVSPFCLPEYHSRGRQSGSFKGPYALRRRCLFGRHVHDYSFDYMRQFTAAYDGRAPWAFISTFLEAHEPSGEAVATMDGALAGFLNGLSPALLNRTVVLVMADHGLHMGLSYLYTQNGRVEEANPFLAVLTPAWLRARHPEAAAALEANQQRLVTAFDLFATFHHLLHLWEQALGAPPPTREQLAAWGAAGNVSAGVQWGASLLSPLPDNRSCAEAGVPATFCWCSPGGRAAHPLGADALLLGLSLRARQTATHPMGVFLLSALGIWCISVAAIWSILHFLLL